MKTFQLQPADVPRDLACFILGVRHRNNWLLSPCRRGSAIAGLALGVAGALTFIGFDLTGHSFFSMGGDSSTG
jgi:hypothetical protein